MARSLSSAGRSETGLVRKRNEDAILLRDEIGLWAVADGLGGHDAGDLASKMVVERLAQLSRPEDPLAFIEAIEDALLQVNEDLRLLSRQRGLGLIGSTVVVLVAAADRLLCGWVGDSRAYAFERGALRAITRDHVAWVAQDGMATGRALNLPLSRAIGASAQLCVEWAVLPSLANLRVLLCSDGINKELDDSEVQAVLAEDRTADALVDRLLAEAHARGARDNVSAVVVAFGCPDVTDAEASVRQAASLRLTDALRQLDDEHHRGQRSWSEYRAARRLLLAESEAAQTPPPAHDEAPAPRNNPGALQAMVDWLKQHI